MEQLSDQFTTDELLPIGDEMLVNRLKDKLAKHHNVVLTHSNEPFMIGLTPEVFSLLIRRVQHLEDLLEDLEVLSIVRKRLSKPIPESQWLSEEEFLRVCELLPERSDPTTDNLKDPGR